MAQQALPTEFDNTASVWQNMPEFAAMQVGQQNRRALENGEALQKAYAGEQEFEAQKRPVELSNLRATGDLTRAHTSQYGAQTRGKEIENDIADATKGGKIRSTNTDNQLKSMESEGQMFGQIAAKISDPKMPAFERARIVKEMLKGLPDSPEIDMGLIKNAANLPKMFSDMAERSRQATSAYKSDQEKMKSQEKIASGHDATSILNNRENIAAGKYANKSGAKANDLLTQVKAGKLGYEKAATAFQIMAELEGDPVKAQEYADLASRFEQAKLAAANAQGGAKVDMGSVGRGKEFQSNAPKPALGRGGPKLGTAENPIKLD